MTIIETTPSACGKLGYSRLVVPHDWNPKPLNPCECGGAFDKWTKGGGHECSRCHAHCGGECR